MAKVTAKITGMKLLSPRMAVLYLDSPEIWGHDQRLELKVPVRLIAKLYGLDKKDVERAEMKPYMSWKFAETKELIKNWTKKQKTLKDKWLVLK